MKQHDWAGIVVRQTGDWSSAEASAARSIALMFFPSTHVLDRAAEQCDPLARNFDVPGIEESERTRRVTRMGQLVLDLLSQQAASATIGHIPAARWSTARQMGTSVAVWPLALYLPFVRGRLWGAVTGQDTTAQRRAYHEEVLDQFSKVCAHLQRSDLKEEKRDVEICFYEKHGNQETLWELQGKAAVSKEEDSWYRDPEKKDRIPLEHIRCGLSLCEFVAYVMGSSQFEAATEWRERLRSRVREFDLTAIPW